MRIIITGGNGMLGTDLRKRLAPEHDVLSADLPEWDITRPGHFEHALAAARPDAVIHCAAMTAVDACETDPDRAFSLNAAGSLHVANACRKCGARLIALSTDYVFDGTLDRPYHEFDPAGNARTVYGASKFAGEQAIRTHCPDHLICRTAWLYGAAGPNFVDTMRRLANGSRKTLRVVADQHGNPTSTVALANHLACLLKHPELAGTFHLSCEGEATWADFAAEIFRLTQTRQHITPCTTDEFPRPAPRPKNSRMEKRMLRLCNLPPMPDWHDALKQFLIP